MRFLGLLGIAGLFGLIGCVNGTPHEREDLSRRIMQLEDNELESAYQNKVLFSREVSGGKPGHSAGGGCGCGN